MSDVPVGQQELIKKAVDIIEQRCGISGIDFVLGYTQGRRRDILAKLQDEREKSLKFQREG